MRYLSLFTGIGGIDLGLDRAGWSCAGQVEHDEFCLRVLARHWPEVPKWRDVVSFANGAAWFPVDAVVGGFPCQPHSIAGAQRGHDDERNLWPYFRRIVTAWRPRWVVGENVPGIDTTMLADVVGDLEAEDYEVGVLGVAAATVGAPHRRERRWIIARSMADTGPPEWGADPTPRLNIHGHDVGRTKEASRPAERGAALADADSERRGLQWVRGIPNNSDPFAWTDTDGRDGPRLGNADESRRERIFLHHDRSGSCETSQRIAESRVGSPTDGVPRWMAGPGPAGAWPAGPGQNQAEWEAPRVIHGRTPGRPARLRALGNSVVPQCAELIGRMLDLDSQRVRRR